jgi:hypothetical protein
MIEIEGLLPLEARLEELGVVKIPLAMRKVTVAGAKPMKAAIKAAGSSMFQGQSKTDPGGLVRGVRYKASRGAKGLSYTIGPFGAGTRHRALVIYGHEITGHTGKRTGKRTRPVPFVEAGERAAAGASIAAITAASKVAIEAATKL